METTGRKKRRFDSACDHVERCIAGVIGKGETRLPPIRSMAADAGVSLVTMWKAVGALRRQGALKVLPSMIGSIHLGDDPQGKPACRTGRTPCPQPPLPRWLALKNKISGDILAGVFAPGERIPAYKELSHRYGAHFRVVRPALQSLEQDGRIQWRQGGYVVFQPQRPASGATLVLFAVSDDTSFVGSTTPRSAEFWRLLEGECLRLRMNLQVRSTAHAVGRTSPVAAKKQDHTDRENVVGYIVLTLGIPETMLRDLADRLALSQLPVAFYTEVGVPFYPVVRHKPHRVRSFALASDLDAGRAVGTFLITLGHRRVVTLAMHPGDRLMEIRADGLDEAFGRAGLDLCVSRRYISSAASDEAFDAQLRSAKRYRLMRSSLETADDARQQEPEMIAAFNRQAYMLTLARFVSDQVGTVVAGALAAAEPPTAWVGLTDQMALAVSAQLRRQGVRVPQECSVVGFDNTVEAFGGGLTSLSYNVPAVVHAMIQHVAGYRASRSGCQDVGIVEIPGVIIPRGSTSVAQHL